MVLYGERDSRAPVLRSNIRLLVYPNPWNFSPEAFTILALYFLLRTERKEIPKLLYCRTNMKGKNRVNNALWRGRKVITDVSSVGSDFDRVVYGLWNEVLREWSWKPNDDVHKWAFLYTELSGDPKPKQEFAQITLPKLSSPTQRTICFKFSRCPRCKGPLELQSDLFGYFTTCLLCGFVEEERIATSVSTERLLV